MRMPVLWAGAVGAAGIGLAALLGGAASQPGGQMQQQCQEAAKEMKELRQEIQGIEKRLDKAQAAMNEAKTPDTKLAATMQVVNEMAEQRTLISQKLIALNDVMMGHVMQHLAAGNGAEAKNAMENCPVYKGLVGVAQHLEQTEQSREKNQPKK